ncbi:hypothetical protein PMAYCL1PPCAC_11652, partial [Pristionchus mayeri]
WVVLPLLFLLIVAAPSYREDYLDAVNYDDDYPIASPCEKVQCTEPCPRKKTCHWGAVVLTGRRGDHRLMIFIPTHVHSS